MDEWSHAYCDTCEEIQPTRLEVGGVDETGRFELADLVCAGCHGVIAGLYRPVKGFGLGRLILRR